MRRDTAQSQGTSPLTYRVGEQANAAEIADAIVAIWQEINVALTPIIGQRGVAALYKRSLFLAARSYTWMPNSQESIQPTLGLTGLKAIMVQQSSDDASHGGDALLQHLYELLQTLIGHSLTEQLLGPVWTNSPGDTPSRDTSP